MMRKSFIHPTLCWLVLRGLMVPGEAAAPSQHLKFSLTRPQVRAISDITYAQYFDWPKSFLKWILFTGKHAKVAMVVFVTGGGSLASPKENYRIKVSGRAWVFCGQCRVPGDSQWDVS